MVKVSVVMPIYNDEKFLADSLFSIINQTLKDIEIICINDGSTDNSLNILNNFSEKYSFIKVLNQENEGAGIARNKGMKIAEGEYIDFFDADDYIVSDALEILYENATLNQSDCVIFKAGKFDNNRTYRFPVIGNLDNLFKNVDFKNLIFTPLDIKPKVMNDYYFAPWFKLYNKNFLEENSLQFQDVSSYNDVLFHIQSLLKASKISYVPEYLYYYRIDNANSLTFDNSKHLNIFKVIDGVESFLVNEGLMDDYKLEFDKFKIIQINTHMVTPISKEYFKLAKKYFSEMDLSNNHLIQKKLLDKYNVILNMSEDQIDDFEYYLELYHQENKTKKKIKTKKAKSNINIENKSFLNKLKDKITNKLLNKSNSFIFYKNGYSKLNNENKKLKQKLNNSNNKLNSNLELLNEFKEIYINNLNNSKDSNNKKRILFVLHSGSGGTPKTVNDIVENIKDNYDSYLLTSDRKNMKLSLFDGVKFNIVEEWNIFSNWYIEDCYNDEFSNIYFNILTKYSFDIVHIHHLIFHTFDLPKLCKKLNIPTILSFHDLYFMCPAYTLLDGDHVFCHGKCFNSNSDKNCYMPMKNISKIKNMKSYVNEWRNSVSEMFLNIDYFIAPSNYIKNIFTDTYLLKNSNFKIIEHGIDSIHKNEKLFEIPSMNKPVKILFLGNLYLQKGSEVIKQLHDLDNDSKLEFHFLGVAPSELQGFGVHHGKYELNQLYDFIKEIKPSFIGIFSICGESYCYTLSEAWSFEIPVFVSDLGALKERLLRNDCGWFINVNDVEESYDKIISVIKNPDEYISKQQEIKNIDLISIEAMTQEYNEIYKKFI